MLQRCTPDGRPLPDQPVTITSTDEAGTYVVPADPMVELLDKAKATVTGPRRADYGNPEDDLQCTADLWSTWLNRRFGTSVELTGADVSVLMILLKATRLANTPGHVDSLLDTMGYAATGHRCHVVRQADR